MKTKEQVIEERFDRFLEENGFEFDVKKVASSHYRLLSEMGDKMFDVYPKSGKVFTFDTHKYHDLKTFENALLFVSDMMNGVKRNYDSAMIKQCVDFLTKRGYTVIEPKEQ